MPRQSRESTLVPGGVVHFISRFVDYRFVLDDEARAVYLQLLGRALRGVDWRLISYALMSSHVHLGLLSGMATLRAWCHSLHIRFSRWVNQRLRRGGRRALGPVLAERPTTRMVCATRTRLLISYQHRNPFDAGVVEAVADSSWTSHRAYLGLAMPRAGLDVSLGLRLAGFEPTVSGRRAFHAFVSRDPVEAEQLTSDVPSRPSPPDEEDGAQSRPAPSHVVRVVCEVLTVSEQALLSRSRRRTLVAARRVAIVAWLELGGVAREMADTLGITSSGASRLLSRPHDSASVRASVAQVMRRVVGRAGARVR